MIMSVIFEQYSKLSKPPPPAAPSIPQANDQNIFLRVIPMHWAARLHLCMEVENR
jgi:hypothetical protein